MTEHTTHSAPVQTLGRRRGRLPGAIYVLAAGTFLMGTTEFVIAGLLPEFGADFHVSAATAGTAITVFAIGMIVGAPAMALLTLHLPRRLTLVLALAVFAVGHIVAAITPSFEVLLVARFVTALATGAFWAVAAVVATRLAGPGSASRALGIVLGGGMLANVLGVPLGAWAGQLLGWRGPFWALAALAVVAAATVARTIAADRPDQAAPSIRAELAGLRSPRLWLVLAICATVTGGVLSTYSYIAPLIERAGVPAVWIPFVLLLFGIGAFAGSLLGGRAGDAHPYSTPVVTAAITAVVTIGLVLGSSVALLTVLLFTILGFAGLSANPVLVSLAVRYGHRAPTLASAMATSLFNLGTAVGTGVSAAAMGTSLGVLAPPIVAVGFGAIGVVLAGTLAVLERQRRSAGRRWRSS
ncbi:MFS transporter [Leifsonia poae]|uniref:MFS transporter n=1 Tax=Leifsonia poae TaxID=110933 RepID=A0A9W6H935_9MICO|nr:MFS transporter [Leifsonia poae]GLJ76175.1 MFS transporter [Leifsonia poae]